MAECIMAWAKFDSMFRAMLTSIERRPLDDGARAYSRLKTSMGWTKLVNALKDRGASETVIARVKELENGFRQHVKVRNYIAHAGCVGTWRDDPDYLVFAPFESDRPAEMVVMLTPLDEVRRSTAWAGAAEQLAHRIMRAEGH